MITALIADGAAGFEMKTGERPTEFYLGKIEAFQLVEQCYQQWKVQPNPRGWDDCWPSKYMGMTPHRVDEQNHLSFGLIY